MLITDSSWTVTDLMDGPEAAELEFPDQGLWTG